MTSTNSSSSGAAVMKEPRQHGVKGVYYGGDWLDIEDCVKGGSFDPTACDNCTAHSETTACPRSRTRNSAAKSTSTDDDGIPVYDVCIVGAGCLGAAIARELSRYALNILWVEAADDVSQGATKGNSGIVHAGYDDQPNTVRSQHCWPGNQMFAQLDKELHFGYQRNGSLVLACNDKEVQELHNLYQRGQVNGVKNLQVITEKARLLELEPHMADNVIAALYAPDAGNVIPYEFAIALAENAVDNGVELLIRTKVVQIDQHQSKGDQDDCNFTIHLEHWEPSDYVQATSSSDRTNSNGAGSMFITTAAMVLSTLVVAHYVLVVQLRLVDTSIALLVVDDARIHATALLVLLGLSVLFKSTTGHANRQPTVSRSTPLTDLVAEAGEPVGVIVGSKTTATTTIPTIPVAVDDMLVGGSGSRRIVNGVVTHTSRIGCRYVINCAGGASDQVARLIGDTSFTIKPRLGDYILLNRNQGHLAKQTLFPCPDPVLGKGVLVQTTLWGNLILGPTARDTYKKEARDMTAAQIQEYILSQCKKLVPSFDAKETIHAFCGARAKSDRGDWIIEPSAQNAQFIHVAGIDSPGLAGAPSISLKVVELLRAAGLDTQPNPTFNPNRAPIITPKNGMKGLKMGPVGKFDSDGHDLAQMAANVICKCEKVTELEVVRAMRRSLPIDSSQAIRKRTRAGMGHCQGDPANFQCEARVRAIIARENGTPVSHVGSRPWPATSTLSQRWIDDDEKRALEARMNAA